MALFFASLKDIRGLGKLDSAHSCPCSPFPDPSLWWGCCLAWGPSFQSCWGTMQEDLLPPHTGFSTVSGEWVISTAPPHCYWLPSSQNTSLSPADTTVTLMELFLCSPQTHLLQRTPKRSQVWERTSPNSWTLKGSSQSRHQSQGCSSPCPGMAPGAGTHSPLPPVRLHICSLHPCRRAGNNYKAGSCRAAPGLASSTGFSSCGACGTAPAAACGRPFTRAEHRCATASWGRGSGTT